MNKEERDTHLVPFVLFLLLTVGAFVTGDIASGVLFLAMTVFLILVKPVEDFWTKGPNGWKRTFTAVTAAIVCAVAVTSCSGASKPAVTETAAVKTMASQTTAEEKIPETEAGASSGTSETAPAQSAFDLSTVPAYSGSPYAVVNNNVPFFTESDFTTTSFESYGV